MILAFRKRPTKREMEWYRRITRGWSDTMRMLILPRFWEEDRK